mgnify:CR=1 FL=1
MATLISSASGNFTDASTWKLADSVSSQQTGVTSTALTISLVASASFVPGAITVDGIVVFMASRATSPVGTIEVELWNATDVVQVVMNTCNVSDLPAGGTSRLCFGFSPILLLAGKSYQVRCRTTSASMVNLYRDSTAGNWTRELRTSTAQAPVAGDNLMVLGEITGPATGNSFEIAMNSVAATDYGSANTNALIPALSVSHRGTLSWGIAESTAYILRLSGCLAIQSGGTYNKGTTGARMPATSTALLEFDCAADGDFGLNVYSGGSWNEHGEVRTTDRALLAANASASATVLTCDRTLDWRTGDKIAIGATRRTGSENEEFVLGQNTSSATLTLPSGLVYPHLGTSPIEAEVINLTRNCKIKPVNTSFVSYVYISSGSLVHVTWTEFSYLGTSASNKMGIELAPLGTGSSVVINYCSISYGEYSGIYSNSGAYVGLNIDDNVIYRIALNGIYISQISSNSTVSINNCIIMRVSSGYGLFINPNGSNITISVSNIIIVGCITSVPGFGLSYSAGPTASVSINSCKIHSGDTHGFQLIAGNASYNINLTMTGCYIFRNNGAGMQMDPARPLRNITLQDSYLWGNLNNNILWGGIIGSIKNCVISGDASYSTVCGLRVSPSSGGVYYNRATIESTTFGLSGTYYTTHSTSDMDISGAQEADISMTDSSLLSSVPISSLSYLSSTSKITSDRHNQTPGISRSWIVGGSRQQDAGIFKTTSPSQRLTPISTSVKLESGLRIVAVADGQTVTVNVWVRESLLADGTDYNGNRIRLICKRNLANGVSSDTVIATATIASEGSWEQLTGVSPACDGNGVMIFVVDCDGTTGWINVDDFTVV